MVFNRSMRGTLVALALGVAVGAQAQVFSDFSGFAPINNLGGGGNYIGSSTFQATDGFGGESSSAFYNSLVDISHGFTATFHYVASNPNAGDPDNLGIADGMAFVIQNSAAGVTALGGGGDGLGYLGIDHSVGVALDVWGGVTGGPGTEFYENGALNGPPDGDGNYDHHYNSTGPVDLTDPAGVDVVISWDPTTMKLDEQFFQGASFFDIFTTIDLTGDLGGNMGYIGFTGADGGGWSDQRVSNVRVVTPEPISMSLMGSAALAGFLRMKRRKMSA